MVARSPSADYPVGGYQPPINFKLNEKINSLWLSDALKDRWKVAINLLTEYSLSLRFFEFNILFNGSFDIIGDVTLYTFIGFVFHFFSKIKFIFWIESDNRKP